MQLTETHYRKEAALLGRILVNPQAQEWEQVAQAAIQIKRGNASSEQQILFMTWLVQYSGFYESVNIGGGKASLAYNAGRREAVRMILKFWENEG